MQVRAIEFQENFARVPVEGARQQSLLQRGPELAQQQMSQTGASEQALNLSRPRPATETENAIVDPEQEGSTGHALRTSRRRPRSDDTLREHEQKARGHTGTGGRFDVVI
jgi:hypothetical protein